jgi:hypothetical protein
MGTRIALPFLPSSYVWCAPQLCGRDTLLFLGVSSIYQFATPPKLSCSTLSHTHMGGGVWDAI